MSHSKTEQTIALAGVFQAADAVRRIAHEGECPQHLLETAVRSLFHTNPGQALDVFGDLPALHDGLRAISRIMVKQTAGKDIEVLRYGLNMIHLERHLSKEPDMLNVIAGRIDQARTGLELYGSTHDNVMRNLAGIYTDTISTFRMRINVSGDPKHLKVEENAARIRALLLAGIRAAVLWRQMGGRRWQLIFGRGRIVEQAQSLARNLDH
ncbi:MAG: lysogenization regulator HflD [Halomonadaceae bacterium]|nr:MAG: lysogenization regulator HflD [Halomonadaceae bacterium]